ncbi:MAG: UDP-N-acetylmuramoyl-L-alanine--D-glutamate ligase [bacterium]
MVRVKKDCVGIVGLSKSGLAAAKLYNTIGFKVKGFDDNYNLIIPSQYSGYFTEVYLGKQPQYVINEIKNYKFLIVSPGVPFDHPIIQYAQSVNVPVISEIEAAYRILDKNKTIIGVTGTNGKSTVTTLIYKFLKETENNVYIGGNIGEPFSEVVYRCKDIDNPIIVLELSSFQLKMTNNFRAHIAVITNISPDHLDRHITMQDYINSKLKLFYFQFKKDFAIFDPFEKNIVENLDYKTLKSSINLFYPQSSKVKGDLKYGSCIFYKNGKIIIENLKKKSNNIEIGLDLIKNSVFKQEGIYLNNLLPSLLAAYLYYKSKKKKMDLSKIVEVLNNFVPLDYRLNSCGKWGNIEFFNDSKATNLEATRWSVETVKNSFSNFKNFAVILLMGGVYKYSSKEEFVQELEKLAYRIKDNLLGVISFGKYADTFITPFMKFSLKYMYAFDSLENAFDKAVSLACVESPNYERIGILLAPGGASFDLFNSAEERGKLFEKLIENFLFSRR